MKSPESQFTQPGYILLFQSYHLHPDFLHGDAYMGDFKWNTHTYTYASANASALNSGNIFKK